MEKQNTPLAFMACDAQYAHADTVLVGAPFDGTSSYRPGSRFAPNAIRMESFGIETYSPYLKRELEEISVFDAGDMELPFGSTEKALEIIEESISEIISDEKLPFMIGGEHLVTLGAVRAAAKKHKGLKIIHFDAHADLRDDYMGEKLSHATVIRRCAELIEDKSVYQFGIRSMTKEEDLWADCHTIQNKYDTKGLSEAIEAIGNSPVYLTIDLDVLDPSIFPGTGTPEPGGISFAELISAVHKMKYLNIAACDVNELSPHYDQSGVSTVTACKVIRELLLTIANQNHRLSRWYDLAL